MSVVIYIVVTQLITTLVTGTSTGDTLITSLVPIVCALIPVWAALRGVGGSGA